MFEHTFEELLQESEFTVVPELKAVAHNRLIDRIADRISQITAPQGIVKI